MDEHAVDGGGCTEGGDAVFLHHPEESVGVEAAWCLPLDDGCADDHLAEEFAPGGLGPAGFGDCPVEVAFGEALGEAGSDFVAEGVAVGMEDHFWVPGGAAGEVDEHGVGGEGFADFFLVEGARGFVHLFGVVEPALSFAVDEHDVAEGGAFGADGVDSVGVVEVGDDHDGAGVG